MVLSWLLGGAESEEGEAAGKSSDDNNADSGIADETKGASGGGGASSTTARTGSQPRASDGSGGEETTESGGEVGGDEDTKSGGKKKKKVVLSKSTRLKGYMTFAVASSINYYSANESDLSNASEEDKSLVVAATPSQRKYAMAVAMVTIIVSIFCIIVHFDRFTCLRKAWIEAFKPGSRVELAILIFLLLWWIVATGINTSSTGIAGPGKGQYNLYFSTWVNLWTAVWTIDRWLIANGSASFKTFMDSWPNRSPGWLFMSVLTLICLCSVVDLFKGYESASEGYIYLGQLYSQVTHAEWVFQIFVAAFTLPMAAAFSLVELFRVSRLDIENTKSDRENIIEGFTLLLLVMFWIPVVIIATTPGGSSSLVGNAYFFTWFTTVVVIETFVWWIRDWRKGIHEVVRMQEEEYRRAQREVLRKHKQKQMADGEAAGGKTSPSKK